MYDRAYVKQLENIIMDDLLPMYIMGCRSVGINPNTNIIVSKLIDARKLKEEIPALLNAEFGK